MINSFNNLLMIKTNQVLSKFYLVKAFNSVWNIIL